MGLYCDEAAGDKIINGTEGCIAVLHRNSNHIEVWNEDSEHHFGNVPADFTAAQINVVMSFYRAGWSVGRVTGTIEKQHEICRVLGLG